MRCGTRGQHGRSDEFGSDIIVAMGLMHKILMHRILMHDWAVPRARKPVFQGLGWKFVAFQGYNYYNMSEIIQRSRIELKTVRLLTACMHDHNSNKRQMSGMIHAVVLFGIMR